MHARKHCRGGMHRTCTRVCSAARARSNAVYADCGRKGTLDVASSSPVLLIDNPPGLTRVMEVRFR